MADFGRLAQQMLEVGATSAGQRGRIGQFMLEVAVLGIPGIAAVGQAIETDTALPVSAIAGAAAGEVGLAEETDSAFPLSTIAGGVIVEVGLPTELDTALALAPNPEGDCPAEDAPTTDELLERLLRFVPNEYIVWTPTLAGGAAQLQLAHATVLEMVCQTIIGHSDGKWLTLLARGYGIRRATAENDLELRRRIRRPERKIVKAPIEAAVNEILSSYTDDVCEIFEHWASFKAVDTDVVEFAAIADVSFIYDQFNAFTIEIPDLGVDHEAYRLILAEVNRLKAAGVRWWLVLRGT